MVIDLRLVKEKVSNQSVRGNFAGSTISPYDEIQINEEPDKKHEKRVALKPPQCFLVHRIYFNDCNIKSSKVTSAELTLTPLQAKTPTLPSV